MASKRSLSGSFRSFPVACSSVHYFPAPSDLTDDGLRSWRGIVVGPVSETPEQRPRQEASTGHSGYSDAVPFLEALAMTVAVMPCLFFLSESFRRLPVGWSDKSPCQLRECSWVSAPGAGEELLLDQSTRRPLNDPDKNQIRPSRVRAVPFLEALEKTAPAMA